MCEIYVKYIYIYIERERERERERGPWSIEQECVTLKNAPLGRIESPDISQTGFDLPARNLLVNIKQGPFVPLQL
jgi:hypothetical protein